MDCAARRHTHNSEPSRGGRLAPKREQNLSFSSSRKPTCQRSRDLAAVDAPTPPANRHAVFGELMRPGFPRFLLSFHVVLRLSKAARQSPTRELAITFPAPQARWLLAVSCEARSDAVSPVGANLRKRENMGKSGNRPPVVYSC